MLTPLQEVLLAWYDSLNTEERAAVDYWLETGQTESLLVLRQFSERLKCYRYMPFFERPKEFSLLRS